MDTFNVTYWARDVEGRIDAWLMIWDWLKNIAKAADVQGNCPVRISVRVVRTRPKKAELK